MVQSQRRKGTWLRALKWRFKFLNLVGVVGIRIGPGSMGYLKCPYQEKEGKKGKW